MKFKTLLICTVLAFGMAGASYASWSDETYMYGAVTTGKIELESDEQYDESIFAVDLDSIIGKHSIPFTIVNNSTIPIKGNKVTFSIDGETLEEIGEVELSELEDNLIGGELILNLDFLNEYLTDQAGEDYGEGIFSQFVTVEIEFGQTNTDMGWSRTFPLDIEIFKSFEEEIKEEEIEEKEESKDKEENKDKEEIKDVEENEGKEEIKDVEENEDDEKIEDGETIQDNDKNEEDTKDEHKADEEKESGKENTENKENTDKVENEKDTEETGKESVSDDKKESKESNNTKEDVHGDDENYDKD